MSIKERLQKYCTEKKTTIGTFCRHAGISGSYFNQVKNDIGRDIQKRIADNYDDLNIEWLRTGEGEMFTTNSHNAIRLLGIQANIDTGQTSYKEPEPIPANAEVIPIIPSEVARDAGIDIRKFVEKNAEELDSIDPTKLLKKPDIAEQITGTSMLPTFAPGDIVFIKFIPNKSKIIDGKTYYFDLLTLPTMIRKVKFEGDSKLRLIAKNPAFADIVIHKADVLNVGRVIGMFRQSFGDQYDEIEAVRRHKDHQIDLLIEQLGDSMKEIGKAGTRQDKLIEIIEKKL